MATRIVRQSPAQSDPTAVAPTFAHSAPGIKVERWNWCDHYIGTKDALIAAGIFKDGQFPGDPGRGPTGCSYEPDGTPFRRGGGRRAPICIQRCGKRLFRVWISVDEEEEARRREAEAARDESRKKAEEAEAEVKRETEKLSKLPATEAEFAKRAADTMWSGLHVFFMAEYAAEGPGKSGYWFSVEDRDRFGDMARALYWEIRQAQPCFDATSRMLKVNEARAKCAKADAPLQQLLQSVTKASMGVRHE